MPLDDNLLKGLVEILKDSCAFVRGVGGKSSGSGFFIDQDLLLTCAHVVKGEEGSQVDVHPYKRKLRKGTILRVLHGDATDLALVRVERLGDEPPLDAAALHTKLDDNIDYFTVGSPVEAKAADPGIQAIRYQGHADADIRDAAPALLILQSGGPLVPPGLSGGAVMSSESGAVVAIVQYRRERTFGGGAIPVHRAAALFEEEVGVLLTNPGNATKRWRDKLGRDAWSKLGKPVEEWREQLDIVIKGDASCWEIRLGDGTYTQTARELPNNVSHALFHWARRRRVHDKEAVELLGELLSAALFPADVLNRVKDGANNDQTLVRLKFEESEQKKENELIDVPWEFVTVEINGRRQPVAVAPNMGLVRVSSHPNKDLVDTSPRDRGTVLGMVMDPEGWAPETHRRSASGKKTSAGWLAYSLEQSVKHCPSLELVPLTNVTRNCVKDEASKNRQPPVEIMHYVGFGRYNQAKRVAELAFADRYGETDWTETAKVFEWVADSRARLLIVELLLPHTGLDLEPIPPAIFQDALLKRLNAVVYTRLPVHPRLSDIFNDAFYKALARGETVEAAMQLARGSELTYDVASFGWFSLLTGPKANTQLLHARAKAESEQARTKPIPQQDQPGVGRAEQPVSQDRFG